MPGNYRMKQVSLPQLPFLEKQRRLDRPCLCGEPARVLLEWAFIYKLTVGRMLALAAAYGGYPEQVVRGLHSPWSFHMSEQEKPEDDEETPDEQLQNSRASWKELLVLAIASAVTVTGLALYVVYNHGEEFSSQGLRLYALIFVCVIVAAWVFYLLDRYTGVISWSRDHINLVGITIMVIVVAVIVGIIVYQAHKGSVTRKNNILKLYQICDDEKAMLERCQIEYGALVEEYDSPVDILRVPLSNQDMSNLEDYELTLSIWEQEYPNSSIKESFDEAVYWLNSVTYDVKQFMDEAWSYGKIYAAEDFNDAKAAYDSAKVDLDHARTVIDKANK